MRNKDMKEKKATSESGLIAEYLKALKDVSIEELRVFFFFFERKIY